MRKKEIKRLQNLLTVKVDALVAWILLKEFTEILAQGDRDPLTVGALKLVSQDLCDSLTDQGLISENGPTEKLVEYVELTYPSRLQVVK